MNTFQMLLYLHVLAGFTALTVFWIPLVTKKGGRIHKRVGWVYVWAMGIVAATAFYMGTYRIGFDDSQNAADKSFAFFLLFIAILSASTAWNGIRVLRFKRRTKRHRLFSIDTGISLLLVLSSIITIAIGWVNQFPLLQYFPVIGLFLGYGQLKYWLTPPQTKMHWYFEHFGNLIGCSIATITAFTVFGAPRLLNISSISIFLWFLPTVVLTPLIIGFSRYYRKKFRISTIK
ncbi:DUF2306 domain-containing protein [Halobacillus halophilus]|uniref:DUF2306 domain-containing protein n=1 Tax=Halobacillus halophilus TaxID=1570 RepID=UPI001CD3551E|nr:DUF2306 domain-containing protein [Halobacillus halophilus]MCA1011793.1 DUF2306 domain-containing protein [Halobacillus halophilus]